MSASELLTIDPTEISRGNLNGESQPQRMRPNHSRSNTVINPIDC